MVVEIVGDAERERTRNRYEGSNAMLWPAMAMLVWGVN